MNCTGISTDDLIQTLIDEAAKRGSVIYNFACRNAGWGAIWFDQTRCTTPLPEERKYWKGGGSGMEALATQMRYERETNQARMREGIVVHKYYPTFRDMLEGEFTRLLEGEETE